MNLHARSCSASDGGYQSRGDSSSVPAPQAGLDPVAKIRVYPPAIMTLVEAATYLAVSKRTVEGLIATRQLRVSRLGRRVLIRREWLDDLVG